ncbi:unnamed protein product, partial [Lampetra fluviatilis]
TLGPPSLTLNVTTLWISGPFVASGRRSGLSVAQVYNTPRYEVSYYTRGEEAREDRGVGTATLPNTAPSPW